ncbi:MAG: hypothetical protein HYX75_08370 [Acidobacteria bacterium]|nr:hypothetical protein [Acidobacteriota bacterium]
MSRSRMEKRTDTRQRRALGRWWLLALLAGSAWGIIAVSTWPGRGASSLPANADSSGSTETKAGGGWTPDRRLTFDPGASRLSPNFAWSVAADAGGRVHVVWYDDRAGTSQVYYKRSPDQGTSWGPDTRLSKNPAWREHPAIAV